MFKKWVFIGLLLLLMPYDIVYGVSFTGIGDLPGGVIASAVSHMSDDGRVVMGSSNVVNNKGFRWTRENGMVQVGDFGDSANFITQSSYDGRTLLGRGYDNHYSSGMFSYVWKESLGVVHVSDSQMGYLLTGNGDFMVSTAGTLVYKINTNDFRREQLTCGHYLSLYDISFDGSVIVGAASSRQGLEMVKWTEDDGWFSFGKVEKGAQAQDVSKDGSAILGLYDTDDSQRGVLYWDESLGLIKIENPIGIKEMRANGILIDDGSKFFTSGFNGNTQDYSSFSWTPDDGYTEIGSFYVNDASSDGSYVIGQTANGKAVIWNENEGLQLLSDILLSAGVDNLDGWELNCAIAISDDGNIISGNGHDPLGNYSGWVVDLSPAPVPEPSTILLMGLGLLGLLGIKSRKKKS